MAVTYEPIATTTLGSAAASITFSSIPSTYTDLRIILAGNTTATSGGILLTYNNDTATNYSRTYLLGDGSAASTGSQTTRANIPIGNISSGTLPIYLSVDIFSYAGSTYKTSLANNTNDQNGGGNVQVNVGLWRSTSAINRLDLTAPGGDTFKAGTTATLYGIRAA